MKNTYFAAAKINLYLRIVGRRADGYHDTETLFQRIALYDHLTIEEGPIGGSPFRLAVIGKRLEEDDLDKNLVVRAWEELSRACPFAMRPVRIVLDKRIPVKAGLGGGSSDAASTLMALRDMFSLPLDDAALRSIGARLEVAVPRFSLFARRKTKPGGWRDYGRNGPPWRQRLFLLRESRGLGVSSRGSRVRPPPRGYGCDVPRIAQNRPESCPRNSRGQAGTGETWNATD